MALWYTDLTASSNVNIVTHQLFSKQWFLGVGVAIVQWKISADLTRTGF